MEAGDLAAAETARAAALAQTRDTGDVQNQAILLSQLVILDLEAGRLQDAAAHLREAIQVDTRTAKWGELGNGLDCCGLLCAATGRPAEAVTVWAAHAALLRRQEFEDTPGEVRRREGRCDGPGRRSDPAGPGQPKTAARR
jgi:predicted RNA-binding Zn ribbon-like protein